MGGTLAGPADLYDAATEWLAVCLAAVGTTVGGTIERAYVSAGLPAWDCCPQLTIHVGGPAEGDTAPLSPPLQPGQRNHQTGIVPLVPLTCTVLRCLPSPADDGTPPSADALDAAGHVISEDVWAIWAHTRKAITDGELFASPSGSREVMFQPALSQSAQGLCAGWEIPIHIAVGGYRPE